MMLLMKFTPQITQEPGWGPKDLDVTLDTGTWQLSWWSDQGVTYAIMCFVKWSFEHQDIGDLRQSIQLHVVISMLVKSTCKRSIRAVATIGCRGALDK